MKLRWTGGFSTDVSRDFRPKLNKVLEKRPSTRLHVPNNPKTYNECGKVPKLCSKALLGADPTVHAYGQSARPPLAACCFLHRLSVCPTFQVVKVTCPHHCCRDMRAANDCCRDIGRQHPDRKCREYVVCYARWKRRQCSISRSPFYTLSTSSATVTVLGQARILCNSSCYSTTPSSQRRSRHLLCPQH